MSFTESSPKRILLDMFTITVSPTDTALTIAQAGEVKDVAEDLAEPVLRDYNWGSSTIYQYMGFTNVKAVSFYGTHSVISINGGIVSFDGSSETVPTQAELQEMIQDVLDTGLTNALQATQDFSYVTETNYTVLWEPTPAPTGITTTLAPMDSPTIAPTEAPVEATPVPTIEEKDETPEPTTAPTEAPVTEEETAEAPAPAPTLAPTEETTLAPVSTSTDHPMSQPSEITIAPTMFAPTRAPTVDPGNTVPAVSEQNASPTNTLNDMKLPTIVGVVAGLLLVVSIAALFVYRRRKAAHVWSKNAEHIHPAEEDDLEAPSTSKQGGLQAHDGAAISDAGSSRLGRLLSATAAAVHGGVPVATSPSEVTPPQSSSDESEGDDFSVFSGLDDMLVEPIIMEVLDTTDVEQPQADASSNTPVGEQESHSQLVVLPGNVGFAPANDMPQVHVNTESNPTLRSDPECRSPPLLLPDNPPFDRRWSDVSSNHSSHLDFASDEDNEQQFKPDESWDFNDNDDDSEELRDDPFQTPSNVPANDEKPLLRQRGLEEESLSDVPDSACSTADDDSDAIINDPFHTPSTIPTNDEKPLLRYLGTYNLGKVLTSMELDVSVGSSDSAKRRRSKSAPPLLKNRTVDL